ncbi:MAG: hypothetical protein Q4A60_07595 [Pasteurellaceae bacterium]|nr:hypothetical protein [Pasteurellaceae bacterium]
MNLKHMLIIFPVFSLSGCLFSDYMVSDQEAYQLGKESKITELCLNKSHIQALRNLSNQPSIGIYSELQFLARETIGSSVLGGRYQAMKRDYLFHSSMDRRKHIFQRAMSDIQQVTSSQCKPYLDHYESAYYRLKAQGL